MEEEKIKIKLPAPIHIKKIHQNLDLFSEQAVLRRWPGNDMIDTLFYLYLFNKYKSHCLIKFEGVESRNALGIELQIFSRMHKRDREIYTTHLNMVANQLANCIKRGVKSIVIPLYLKTPLGGHANILIYRKDDSVIEHFEPHGDSFASDDREIVVLIDKKLNEFITILNKMLKKDRINPVTLVNTNIVCPTKFGLQIIESMIPKKKIEGYGYCSAWSMFFTELALKNPSVSSDKLINIIFDKLDTMDRDDEPYYLRNVIVGYINMIYSKLQKYFSFISGKRVTMDFIIDALLNGGKDWDIFKMKYNSIVDIEMQLLNNPSLTREEYIENLQKQERKTTNPMTLEQIRHQIQTLDYMETLLNPSPITKSKTESKTTSRSPTPTKSKTIKNSPKLTPNSPTGKTRKLKPCPEGKFRNPKTGRCKNIVT